jgi:hypothetical protein
LAGAALGHQRLISPRLVAGSCAGRASPANRPISCLKTPKSLFILIAAQAVFSALSVEIIPKNTPNNDSGHIQRPIVPPVVQNTPKQIKPVFLSQNQHQ